VNRSPIETATDEVCAVFLSEKANMPTPKLEAWKEYGDRIERV